MLGAAVEECNILHQHQKHVHTKPPLKLDVPSFLKFVLVLGH